MEEKLPHNNNNNNNKNNNSSSNRKSGKCIVFHVCVCSHHETFFAGDVGQWQVRQEVGGYDRVLRAICRRAAARQWPIEICGSRPFNDSLLFVKLCGIGHWALEMKQVSC